MDTSSSTGLLLTSSSLSSSSSLSVSLSSSSLSSLSLAEKTALEAPTDQSLRVPCYCEENVWRLAFRKMATIMARKDTNAISKLAKEKSKAKSNFHNDDDDDDDDDDEDVNENNNKEEMKMEFNVVYVTNPQKCVPMFQQLASKDEDGPVFWDYHVILLGTTTTTKTATTSTTTGAAAAAATSTTTTATTVFDIDSRLSYPCDFDEYLFHVFPPQLAWKEAFKPCFRVIRASTYLEHFSSDRMHMYDAKTKTWNATPPTYDCIQGKRGENNLNRYMTISKTDMQQQQNITIRERREKEKNPFGTVYTLEQLKKRFQKE